MNRAAQITFTLPGSPPEDGDRATLVNPYAEGTEAHRTWAQGYEAAGHSMFLQLGITQLEGFLDKYRNPDGSMPPAAFTHGQMCRGKDRFLRGAMEVVLHWLLSDGLVTETQKKPSSRGGRPTRIFQVAEDFPSAEEMADLWLRLEREVYASRTETSAGSQDQEDPEFTPEEAARA